MTADPITRAWVTLLALSAGSVGIALVVGSSTVGGIAGAMVLVLAWLKARVILSRYLGLWQAPAWRTGFDWVLALFCLLLLALYLIPALA